MIEGSNLCDLFGLLVGYVVEVCDAGSAYTQTGPPAFIWLAPELTQSSRRDFRDPDARLWGNLYGHPAAGDYWEDFAVARVASCEFFTSEGWNSTFRCESLAATMVVYVDDFKLAGADAARAEARRRFKAAGLKLSDPERYVRYLGCNHHSHRRLLAGLRL